MELPHDWVRDSDSVPDVVSLQKTYWRCRRCHELREGGFNEPPLSSVIYSNVCVKEKVMEIDIRKHPQVREDVHDGLMALKVQARQIWGDEVKHTLPEVVVRLTVGVGDLARVARDLPWLVQGSFTSEEVRLLKKELGNIIFSTIRWIDDLGLDVLECLDLAIEAQEKFAKSGRPR